MSVPEHMVGLELPLILTSEPDSEIDHEVNECSRHSRGSFR